MQNFTLYSWNEIIALVFSVLIGSGAYLGYLVLKKGQKLKFNQVFWVLLINLFVTNTISEFLKLKNFGEYRTIALPLAAFFGQWIVEWADKRRNRIFDAAAKNVGLDLNTNNNENEETENIEKGGD